MSSANAPPPEVGVDHRRGLGFGLRRRSQSPPQLAMLTPSFPVSGSQALVWRGQWPQLAARIDLE